MASTYSDLKIELIGTGDQSGTWGNTTNTNLGTALEEAISGRATANFPSDADLTLTFSDSNASQVARNYILNVTSSVSLTVTRDLIVPTIDKPYIIENNTTGSQSIRVKTSTGSGITVPNGRKCMVYANSTNVVQASDFFPTARIDTLTSASATLTSAAISGGTITGITDLAIADGGTGASSAPAARTNLGATTVGSNLFTLADPSAITFVRVNADNTVSALNATDFKTAISAANSGAITASGLTQATARLLGRTTAGTGAPEEISVGSGLTLSGGQLSASIVGFKNLLINGAMAIDQRNSGAAQSFTAGAALAYSVDRWYGYCTGANVTGQRVAGTTPNQFNYRFTGAASVTKIGFSQRIEAANSQHLAGTTATLSVDLANSLLTTVTWTAWYANTADTFGTLASPTRTQIATGTFTVNSTLTRYSANISIPAAATTGIEIEFSVGSQTSGTWTIGRAQLEAENSATSFDYRPVGQELMLCQRYYFCVGPGLANGLNWPNTSGTVNSTTVAVINTSFPVPMRVAPSALEQSGTAANYGIRYTNTFADCSAVPVFGAANTYGCVFTMTVASGLTVGQAVMARTGSASGTSAYLGWSAEL